ncbi:sigma factor [Streptomyces sp. NPDC058423]|uniref:sigma factor n=1 Tax=unclassified Streptomyces TaxID=2593676 RepID=UPI0036532332
MSTTSHEDGDFALLWAAARPHVAAYCRRVMPGRADAEDLTQVVALRAWRGFASFRGDSSFMTWVMSIAEREAARLGARLARKHARETGWSGVGEPQADAPAITGPAQERDRAVGRSGAHWLPVLAEKAHDEGILGELEYKSVTARLSQPGIGWNELAEKLGSTANACAVAHCRALPKLRVLLFLREPDRLGGPSALAEAYEAARSSASAPLTDAEAEAFRLLVLARRTDYRRRGWQAALRGGCAKVARHLELP